MENPDKETDAQKLRKAAEAKVEQDPRTHNRALTEAEATRLIHELEVHQIELEMQNKELLRAKNILQTEKQKYTELYDLAPMAYFTLSLSGEIIELNHSGAAMLGTYRSALKNSRFQMFIPYHDLPVFNQFIEDVFNKPGSQSCEVELKSKKGQKVFAMLHSVAIASTARCLVTALDITEQKQATDDLYKERTRLSNVLEGTNAGTWEWDITSGEIVINDRWAKIVGYTLDEISPLTNQTFNKLSHPEDLKKSDSILEKHFRGELDYYDCQVRMKHKDGRWIWTLHRGKVKAWSKDRKPLLMSGTQQDINGHKLAEEALKASEQRNRALLDAIPDLMFRINKEGVFLDYKMARGELYMPNENIIGKEFRDIVPPEMAGLIAERNAEIIKTGKMRVDEYKFNIPGKGSYAFEALSVRSFPDEVIVIVRNISERKKTEAEIKQKNLELQKLNATKDKFFSIIAHDLKSPFNSIVGFSDLLVEQVKDHKLEGIEQYAEYIQKSSQRAMELLSNLMDWSRSQTGRMTFKPELCDLYTIINQTTDLLNEVAKQKSIEIKNRVASEMPVFADLAMLATVLRNLISNAIKFTRPGGLINISARAEEGKTIIAVADNGIGIPEDKLEKLFRIDENVSTTGTNNEQGTGLGLILCREFIEKHAGEIWVESSAGKGTVFHFSLPAKN